MNKITKILSFDWDTKKKLTVYNPESGKIKKIANSIEAFTIPLSPGFPGGLCRRRSIMSTR